MLISLLFVIAGIAVLVYSANVLVESASTLARYLGLSLAIVGAIVVGFGTSLPEFAVSITASARDDLNLAAGNVVGSMIANLTIVLGGAALLGGTAISTKGKRIHLPLSLASVLVFVLVIRGGLSRWSGVAMLLLLIISLILMIKFDTNPFLSQQPSGVSAELPDKENYQRSIELSKLLLSLIGVVGASYIVTQGAMDLAKEWGVQSGLIGVSLVAVGTSLPELVASIVSVKKGKHGLIIGTVLGSNIFNGFGIGGLVGVVGPGKIEDGSILGTLEVVAMLGVVGLSALFIISTGKLGRFEAVVLIAAYAVWMFIVSI
ncbi:MAG: sodium:calcium antiporter [Acidimicrobiales bacterium]|nr:sodium:calcium antiporter [Acidimicrobiales bacterium]